MLGYGIYFSDSIATSLKYAKSSRQKRTRLIAICEVALGKCLDYADFDKSLKSPPPGYNSTHGDKSLPGSKFVDDEYVIYDVGQYKLKYIVELRLNPDDTTDNNVTNKLPIADHLSNNNASIEDLNNKLNNSEEIDKEIIALNKLKPVEQQSSSLKSSKGDGHALPLKSVHVRAKLVDMSAKVTIYQEYENDEDVAIEAEYLFPLNDGATVCGFEAYINEKHVIGVCKEREQAHREYKEAIAQGKGAYLMDQETSELFKVNVGNLPPKCKCVIKITYLTELDVQDERFEIKMPFYNIREIYELL
jgi:poly [ADP-ribose] polymerase